MLEKKLEINVSLFKVDSISCNLLIFFSPPGVWDFFLYLRADDIKWEWGQEMAGGWI